MLLTLFHKGKAITTVLPERVTGKYILSSDDERIIAVEGEGGKWFLKSNKRAYLKDKKQNVVRKLQINPFQTYTIFSNDGTVSILYAEPPTKGRNEFTRHEVTRDEIIIGRSQQSHICFRNELVSKIHCRIIYDSHGNAVVRDEGSANGTYLNGEKIEEATLTVGDVISIMGLKIVFNGRLLSLNNPHEAVFLDRDVFKPFVLDTPILEEEEALDDFGEEEMTGSLFYRSPRFKRDIERKEIKIDPPPQKDKQEETPIILILGPSITMGMASLTMGLFVLQRALSSDGDITYAIPTLIMSFSMIIGMVLWPILAKRFEKKKRIEREKIRQEKYKKYLEDMKQVILEECHHQSEILHENHVPLPIVLDRVKKRKRNLWERVIGQDDFLKVRLGLGDLPLEADIKFPDKKFTIDEDNLQDELFELAETPQILKKVPVTLSLYEEKVCGIIGDRKEVIDFVKGLILQLATLHSYDELKFVFVYEKKEQKDWKFVKWLPHVWNDDRTMRFIATDANELKELSVFFERVIAQRSEMSEQDLEDLTQHYVIFSMSKSLSTKGEMFNLLLKEKKNIGVSLVTLYDDIALLPKESSKVVELGREYSKIFDKDDTSGQYTAFHADIFYRNDPEDLAIEMANIQLATSNEGYTLPEMLTFLEMFGVSKIEHLNALTRWKENDPTRSLQAPIGVNTMGETFLLDLHEKYHGPHGLIAGMTGSGKSEFIMTFILSLAVNYHPDEVAFILIDYKGGGMANAFLNLPHLAGTITNLDGAAVNRSLISIQSELKRRQAIFSKASREMNVSNIDIYKYQKMYREGLVDEPLQHLFIISDEFAELKQQQPEFMEQLVSAARIGRSLGVHLILATQKPSGVVDDQIWSNSKFRISLKVQEKADSMEVIKRPDAAEISTTGRFYLQVGYNELFELGQSAWAGAPYYPAEKLEKSEDHSVSIIDNLGRVVKSAKIDKQKSAAKNPPKQIDEVVKYLENLAKQENIRVKPLWLEPIPSLIYLEQLREKYSESKTEKFRLNPIIGEYDDPANQRQSILRMPISDGGNTVIYGIAGSGKTTFIATIIYSLMEEHTPDEVNFYLVDFSSESLAWYHKAPHVGDVVLSHESEKLTNLFKLLNEELEKRRRIFSNFGGDFVTYNQTNDEPLPALVVVIHNYSGFSEMYEDLEEQVSFLTREGLRYGIYFIVTAANTGAIRYRLLQNFKQLYVLQLNDPSDYSGVLGNVEGVYPSKYKGRGIIKMDAVYEFQVAHIKEGIKDMYSYITDYCLKKQQAWGRTSARRIPVLPEKVDIDYLQEEWSYLKTNELPVGIEKSSMAVSYYNFKDDFVNIVSAQDMDVCTPFMYGLTEVLIKTEEQPVTVIDPLGSLSTLRNDCHYAGTQDELEETIVSLFNTLVYRNNTKKEALEKGEKAPQFEQMMCVIHSFSDLIPVLSEDANDKLKVFLEKGDSLNVNIIIADSADRLNGMTFEPWFQKQVSLSDAIWIGNGITEQYVLKVAKLTNDLYMEIPEDFGYILTKGKVKLVKLLSPSVQEAVAAYG